MVEISEELLEMARDAYANAIRQNLVSFDDVVDPHRAVVEAIAPMIRAAALEEAASIAEAAYYQQCCGRGQYECCGDTIMAAEEPVAIAASIRSLA